MVLLSAGRLLMRSGNFRLAYSVAMWKTRDSDSLPQRRKPFRLLKTVPSTYFNAHSSRPLHFCAGSEFNLASKFDKHPCVASRPLFPWRVPLDLLSFFFPLLLSELRAEVLSLETLKLEAQVGSVPESYLKLVPSFNTTLDSHRVGFPT